MNQSIVFFGTPDFAVGILNAIIDSGIKVAAIVTAPDRPAGRGKHLSAPAVKKYALSKFGEKDCPPILQPEKLKESSFLATLQSFNADLFFVVAFRMLPREVWTMPQLGTVNLHASLLPHYRGAAPINRAIMNGETTTGLTTFLIDDKIDTGNILMRSTCPIDTDETAGELHDKLMNMGGEISSATIRALFEGKIDGQPQTLFIEESGIQPKQAPKIFPEECFIDWNNTTSTIHNFVRGLSPYPGARTMLKNGDKTLMCKILKCVKVELAEEEKPIGTIITNNRNLFRVACSDGYIDITELQIEGKRLMTTEELLCGFNLLQWEIIS